MEKNLLDIIAQSGIVGAGGAGFPTHVKLNAQAEYVIVNGAECEPLLRVDQQLMALESKKLCDALDLVKKAVGAKYAVIALKSHYHDAIDSLNKVVPGYEGMRLHLMGNFYPAGDEQVMVYDVTGRIVPEGGIPLKCGVIVSNVETLLNIYDAYYEDKPVTDSYVTLTGEVRNRITVKLPLGITVKEALDLAGGVTVDGDFVVINGGPMMGNTQWDLDGTVTKGTSALLFFSDKYEKKAAPCCIHCGKCVSVCPMHLEPVYLALFAKSDDLDKCLDYNLMSCMECGSCSFICPGNVPIVQYIREAKDKIKAKPKQQ